VIYLGQPYTHPNPKVMAFRAMVGATAAKICAERGEPVFAPIPYSIAIDPLGELPHTFEFWEALDLPIIGICSELRVLPLPGWSTSAGLKAEAAFAVERGIPVVHAMALLDTAMERLGFPSWREWGTMA